MTLLVERLAKDGLEFEVNYLQGVEGYWRHEDCYRWEGSARVRRDGRWQSVSLGCWDTMTACIRKGIGYDWESSWSIEVWAA